jgi:ABC-type multidrug transport system ATPase subunit
MTTRVDGAPLIAARGLTRRFGAIAALDGVDLEIRAGESVALLGANGAGKTTLLSILAGPARASAGAVDRGASRVGWVPQRPAVYQRLTVRENLSLFAGLEGAADADALVADLIARADLGEVARVRAGRLSTGTLQRLNLCVALAGRPQILLLDEPTANLSTEQRRRLWEWLERLRDEDRVALLFSTQSVDEARRHGERLVVLAGGRVVLDGPAGALVDPSADLETAERALLDLIERAP